MLKLFVSFAILPVFIYLAACDRQPNPPTTDDQSSSQNSDQNSPQTNRGNALDNGTSDADALQGSNKMTTTDGGTGGRNGADESGGVGGRDLADESLVRSGVHSTTFEGNQRRAQQAKSLGINEGELERVRTALRIRGYTVEENLNATPEQAQNSIRDAIMKFQKDRNLPATGKLDSTTASALNFQGDTERSPASVEN